MGLEIRRVPPGWEHPTDERGEHIPVLDEDYESAGLGWVAELLAWVYRIEQRESSRDGR